MVPRLLPLAPVVLVVGLLAGCPIIPVASDGPRTLRTEQGRLERGDDTIRSGEYADAYVHRGRAGEVLDASVSSSDFDTYLMIRGPGDYAEDNDDASGTNSRLSVTLPRGGEYRVIVTSYRPGETGAYDLSIEGDGRADGGREGGGESIAPGETVRGSLDGSLPTRAGGQPYRRYTFEGSTGARATVEMTAHWDTYLVLRSPDGGEVVNDDISESNRNSRLVVDLTASGTHEILASSYSSGQSGSFDLHLDVGSMDLPGDGGGDGGLSPGLETDGRLEANDETLDTGHYVDVYRVEARAGETLAIVSESSEIDTFLIATGPDGTKIENDDAPGMGTNSRIDLDPPVSGTYRIGVSSYGAGETGRYRLTVSSSPSDAPRGNLTGRVHGVFVGITDYPSGDPLTACAEDAERLHGTLRDAGHLSPASSLLVDGQATVSAIRGAFRRAARACGPDDVFIFFYSGHGGQEPGTEGELDGVNETLHVYDGSIVDDEMNRWFGQVRARIAMIALDSCYSGGFRDVISEPGRMGIYSSEEDVTSSTAGKFEAGGYLSYFLRRAMSGAADTGPADGTLAVGELTRYLRRMWATEVQDVVVSTDQDARTYQNLVVDRGSIKVSDVLFPVSERGGEVPSRTSSPASDAACSGRCVPRSQGNTCSCTAWGQCGMASCVND